MIYGRVLGKSRPMLYPSQPSGWTRSGPEARNLTAFVALAPAPALALLRAAVTRSRPRARPEARNTTGFVSRFSRCFLVPLALLRAAAAENTSSSIPCALCSCSCSSSCCHKLLVAAVHHSIALLYYIILYYIILYYIFLVLLLP